MFRRLYTADSCANQDVFRYCSIPTKKLGPRTPTDGSFPTDLVLLQYTRNPQISVSFTGRSRSSPYGVSFPSRARPPILSNRLTGTTPQILVTATSTRRYYPLKLSHLDLRSQMSVPRLSPAPAALASHSLSSTAQATLSKPAVDSLAQVMRPMLTEVWLRVGSDATTTTRWSA